MELPKTIFARPNKIVEVPIGFVDVEHPQAWSAMTKEGTENLIVFLLDIERYLLAVEDILGKYERENDENEPSN